MAQSTMVILSRALAVTGILIVTGLTAWGQADGLSGSLSASYRNEDRQGEEESVNREMVNLNYSEFLNDRLRMTAFGTYNREDFSTRQYPDHRPTVGFRINGNDFNVLSTFASVEDRNYLKGTAELDEEYLSSSFQLTRDDLPTTVLTWSRSTALDDLSPRTIDNEKTTLTGLLTKKIGIFDARYQRSVTEDTDRVGSFSTESFFSNPTFAAADATGALYVVDTGVHRALKFDNGGNLLFGWGGYGASDGRFNNPRGVAVDPTGYVYVVDSTNNRVQKFDGNGNFLLTWGAAGAGNGDFINPTGIAADASGVYVVDTGNNRIQKFTLDGVFVAAWGATGSGDGQFLSPQGIAVGANDLYVADTNNHRIQRFDKNGNFLSTWGGFGSGNGLFSSPEGIGVDSSGFVYVADTQNHRIQKFTPAGAYVTRWGSAGNGVGQFQNPAGVAVDPSASVFVVDRVNIRVQKFLGDGTFLLSIAGASTPLPAQKRKSVSDIVGVGFSHAIGASLTLNGSFTETASANTDDANPLADTESVNRNSSFNCGFHPMRDVTFSYGLFWNETVSDIEWRGRETGQFSVTNQWNLAVELHRALGFSTGYTTSVSDSDDVARTNVDTKLFNLRMMPVDFASVGMGVSRAETEQQEAPASVADTYTFASSIKLYRDVESAVNYSFTDAGDPATDAVSRSHVARYDFYIRPMAGVSSTISGSISNFDSRSPVGSFGSTQSSYGFHINYQMNPFTLANGRFGYMLTDPDGGPEKREISYGALASHRWALHDLTLEYSATREEETNGSLTASVNVRPTDRTAIRSSVRKMIEGVNRNDTLFSIEFLLTF